MKFDALTCPFPMVGLPIGFFHGQNKRTTLRSQARRAIKWVPLFGFWTGVGVVAEYA